MRLRRALDAFPLTAQNVNVISPADRSSANPELGTILIVDDDHSVVDTFSRLLKLEGYEIRTALDPASTEEAWARNRRDEFTITSGGESLRRP